MKTLRQAVNDYLMMRRSLGFKLYHVERDLESFVSFMEREKAQHIAIGLALKWAMQPSEVHAAYWAQRLSAVRGFAQHWSAIDAHTQVPPWWALAVSESAGASLPIHGRGHSTPDGGGQSASAP